MMHGDARCHVRFWDRVVALRSPSVRLVEVVLVAAALTSLSCSESTSMPEDPMAGTGSITVQLRTAGPAMDSDGYTVTLDGGEVLTGVQGSVTFDEVSAGEHTVDVSGADPNCAIDGPASQRGIVLASQDRPFTFFFWCVGPINPDIAILYVKGDGEATPIGGFRPTNELRGVRADGQGDTVIVESDPEATGRSFENPSWAPDGSRFAIVRSISEALPREIWVVEADGTGVVRVGEGVQASWSPDGNRLAVVSGSGTLALLEIAGGATSDVDLGSGVEQVESVAWSPTGDRLAVGIRGVQSGLVTVNVDGSGMTFVGEPDGLRREPAWSPTGARLVFRRFCDEPAGCVAWPLWLADADGGNEAQLSVLGEPFQLLSPSWSPDGTRILYTRVEVACGPNQGAPCPSDLSWIAADGSNDGGTLVQGDGPDGPGTWRDVS